MDIFILLLLILLNGVFAMSEIAIVSSRKIRLQQWADDGHKGAQAALQLAEEPTRFLSTVQIGITSISILSGVYGEAAIAEQLRHWLQGYPLLAPYSKPLSLTLMVIFITTLSLILGELVPKRLAMLNPEKVAIALSRPMRWLSRSVAPLVRLLSQATDSVLRLMGAHQSQEPSITEEEIRVLMEQGADEGVFDRAEQELVENIFRPGRPPRRGHHDAAQGHRIHRHGRRAGRQPPAVAGQQLFTFSGVQGWHGTCAGHSRFQAHAQPDAVRSTGGLCRQPAAAAVRPGHGFAQATAGTVQAVTQPYRAGGG
nr:CNNM domain-containing protein [Paludibacterium denitrificans]